MSANDQLFKIKKLSANIPFEIQLEIIKRVLRIKSLIRFRSVSKQWKSVIESSEFITDYSVNQAHQHHLLVQYKAEDSDFKYLSIVDDDDDDCFSQHKFFSVVSPALNAGSILDCCHGLVCLYGKRLVVLWNPSIRKSVGIPLPQESIALGFGVCPKTSEPKIVMITRSHEFGRKKKGRKAMVLALSSTWRSITMNMHLSRSTVFKANQVIIDGVVHWATYDRKKISYDRIISFDMTSDLFGEVCLPASLAQVKRSLDIYKLYDSLAVINYVHLDSCDVWMMIKNGDPKSPFTKLFTISSMGLDDLMLNGYRMIIGFRKNGQPLTKCLRIRDGDGDGDGPVTSLEVYKPCSEDNNDLGTNEARDSFHVLKHLNKCHSHFVMTSYTESLVLLNYHGSISH